jgi:hypothetical protein
MNTIPYATKKSGYTHQCTSADGAQQGTWFDSSIFSAFWAMICNGSLGEAPLALLKQNAESIVSLCRVTLT